MKKSVTIIIPVYNEEKNLDELHSRVEKVVASLPDYLFEMILIDNGSRDHSPEICKRFAAADSDWKYIRFSRNFGLESSFFAGVTYAQGDALIYLFSDLQDPPELIPELLKEWEKGSDIVYGQLTKRRDNSALISLLARVAHHLIHRLSDIDLPTDAADYRLISRNVIDAIKQCRERNRYMRGISHWVGFKQTPVKYAREPRKHGKSSAGLLTYLFYTLSAIISFSTKPIRLLSVLGIMTMFLSVLGAVFYTIITLVTRAGYLHIPPPPPWWATLVILILFFGGLQLFFMGIIGEYVAQIQSESKQRPFWFVEDAVGISRDKLPGCFDA